MSGDFGWSRSAHQYADLYEALVPRRQLHSMEQEAGESRERRAPRRVVALKDLNVVGRR
jgi:hypothetical protein